MGWDFCEAWDSKAKLVEHLTGRALGDHLRTVEHTVRGNTLWAVLEYVKDTGRYTAGKRFIMCFLMRSERNFGWGYKDISEDMGPTDLSCPVKYLDMVPDPGSFATEWRKRVRAAAESKAKKRALASKLAPGMRVRLIEGVTVAGSKVTEPLTIISVKPLRGELGPSRMPVRITPRFIAEILPAE